MAGVTAAWLASAHVCLLCKRIADNTLCSSATHWHVRAHVSSIHPRSCAIATAALVLVRDGLRMGLGLLWYGGRRDTRRRRRVPGTGTDTTAFGMRTSIVVVCADAVCTTIMAGVSLRVRACV